ncbi:MAG: hypothetical protein JXA13_15615 [Anaerolineales bacterium]|nr:hypothetical protein [Anaerolineales bacterium]
MKRRFLASVLTILFALVLTTGVLAQSYSFGVPKEVVHVYWNADGTMSLDYTLVFANNSGAHAIDFVDMGMPNSSFDINTASADVDGSVVSVSRSDYQGSGSGFAVVLENKQIPAGQTGTVHVYVGQVRNVIYDDSDDNSYASGVFSPTWFGSEYVTGSTDLTVVYHLPPGVLPEEPKFHVPSSSWPGPQEPETGLDSSGRVMYTWRAANANAHTQYKFGASFPKTYIPEEAIVAPPVVPAFRFDLDNFMSCACPGFFFLLFFGMPVLAAIGNRNRKLKYLPPKISVEGHGIKRGLSAVEAAILMETPLDKVMTMILFGVIKKDAAKVVSKDPLQLDITKPIPEKLHTYEKEFLEAFEENKPLVRRNKLQTMTINLVKSVGQKMRGFSRKETVDYYKKLNERAWAQVEAADTPEVKSQRFEEALEWTMLDKDYDERTRRTFTGPIFMPIWWHHYDPGYRPSAPSTGGGMPAMTSTTGKVPGGASIPGSAFAASVVGGVQNMSSKVLGDIRGFTGTVTEKTNPVPKSSGSSYRSSGGSSGCACACACAGCACACAGGGR